MLIINSNTQVVFVTFILAFFVLKTQLALITAALVAVIVAFVVVWYLQTNQDQSPGAPGPKPWPVLGSLHLMDGYRVSHISTYKRPGSDIKSIDTYTFIYFAYVLHVVGSSVHVRTYVIEYVGT